MTFDEKLAERVRAVLKGRHGVSEKKLFGGLAILVRGDMSCGVVSDELLVRVGPDAYDDALARTPARAMDLTGRPMKGMVYVARPGIRAAPQLRAWVERGVTFARSLPAK